LPEYLHPGVYIEETSYRGKPIQGVSTSTAGFVGAAGKGPEGVPTLVPDFASFRRVFGEPIRTPKGLGDYLGHSVKSFFENGGARCYVVRVLPDDALASQTDLERGVALRLAPGVTVRGPTRTVRLNALRGVTHGTVLHVFTRPDATSPYAETRTMTVETYDPTRDSFTATAADELPAGVVLDPANTVFLIGGLAPANPLPAGGGVNVTARNRGVDGDLAAIEIRPRDRPPIALTTASAARQDPLLGLDPAGPPIAAGQTQLRFGAASLRRLRVGDQIEVTGLPKIAVAAIADGQITVNAGGAGVDFTTAAAPLAMHLTQRGGAALPFPIPLGNAPAAVAVNMTAGGAFGPFGVPHEAAAMLRAGDVLHLDDGAGVAADVTITASEVAQEIAPGLHTTLAAALGAPGAPTEIHLVQTAANPAMSRLFVGDASRFTAPARAGGENVTITNGAVADPGLIVLVDPAANTLYIAGPGFAPPAPAGQFPTAVGLDTWTAVEGLQVAGDGQDTLRVATTAGLYTGAIVEVDSGSAKFQQVVQSVDVGARTVTFTAGLALGAGHFLDVPPAKADRRAYVRVCEIDVLVYENAVLKETFEGLTWNSDQSTDAGLRHYVARLNDPEIGSKLVTLTEAPGAGLTLALAPTAADGSVRSLAGGSNGSALDEDSLIGEDNGPGKRTGIQALAEKDDIAIVAVPGVTLETVQSELITHCELLRYRMAVLDCPLDAGDVGAVQAHRNHYDSKYAAYYAPWLKALNQSTGRIESFPPSGYMAGIYARSDNTVGVHKAPANEVVRNITDVVLPFTAGEQDVLNPAGVNLIRDLTPRGIRVWGARTVSSDQEWKYLNFRRLFIYIEHSIDIGTQWVVFEPNSESLWKRVEETITPFLIGVWKMGALMGATPEDAFFVKCDRTTMAQDDIDNGRLICQIGLAPVAPAEFVIFQIGQFTASANA
jgi:phage tail sheath protein FI